MNTDIEALKKTFETYCKNSFSKTNIHSRSEPDDYAQLDDKIFKYGYMTSRLVRSSWSESDDDDDDTEYESLFNGYHKNQAIAVIVSLIVPRLKSEHVDQLVLAVRKHMRVGSDGYRSTDYYTSCGYDKDYIEIPALFELIKTYLKEHGLYREKHEYFPPQAV
jgi:hypothetical protein